jgi:hypothetical protein
MATDKNPLFKKKAIRKMRTTSSGEQMYMVNPDGGRVSHYMGYDEVPNKKGKKFAVFPTVAPKPGKELSRNPKDWTEQSGSEANKKGEAVFVRTKRRAEKLAAGSWKKGQDRKEAMKYYREDKRAERKAKSQEKKSTKK